MGDNVILIDNARLLERAGELADQDKTPKVQIAYARKGAWSGDNNLGYEVPFKLNTQSPQGILSMPEYGFPEVWTISLGIRLEHELEDGQFFDCVAEIDFGSGGIMQTFEMDWVDGAVFSLPMNVLNVRARWNDVAAALGFGGPDGIQVSVILSRGSPARSRATKSDPFVLTHEPESISTSSPIPHKKIPRFAKSAQVLPLTDADAAIVYGANFDLQFFANQATATPVLTIPGNFLAPGVKVPIPPFARYYGVTINGTQSTSGWVLFNLFDE